MLRDEGLAISLPDDDLKKFETCRSDFKCL